MTRPFRYPLFKRQVSKPQVSDSSTRH